MFSRNRDQEEENVRELFRRQKRADERFAPPFVRLWEAAARKATWPPRLTYISRFIVAAIVVVLAVASAVLVLRPFSELPGSDPVAQTPSIYDWRSPTASLLMLSTQEFAKTVPQLGKPYFEMRAIRSTSTNPEEI